MSLKTYAILSICSKPTLILWDPKSPNATNDIARDISKVYWDWIYCKDVYTGEKAFVAKHYLGPSYCYVGVNESGLVLYQSRREWTAAGDNYWWGCRLISLLQDNKDFLDQFPCALEDLDELARVGKRPLRGLLQAQ